MIINFTHYLPLVKSFLTDRALPEYGITEESHFSAKNILGIFRLEASPIPELTKYQTLRDIDPIESIEDTGEVIYKRQLAVFDMFTEDIYDPVSGKVKTVAQQKEEYDLFLKTRIQQVYASLVDQMLDSKAVSYGYESIRTAVTYADEPSVPHFQIEGQAFRQWRSVTYATLYQISEQVANGEVEVNNFADLQKLLPKFPLDAPEEEIPPPPPPPPETVINYPPDDNLPPIDEYFFAENIYFPGFYGTNPEVLPPEFREEYDRQVLEYRKAKYAYMVNNPVPPPPEPPPEVPPPYPQTPISEPTAAPTEPQPNTVDPTDISSTAP